MSYETVQTELSGLVRKLVGGRFFLSIPPRDSSVDAKVSDFLENDAVKLLDVIGTGPLLYTHDDDVIVNCQKEMLARAKAAIHFKPAVMVPEDDFAHALYYISSGIFYLSPNSFAMEINMGAIPVLSITKCGRVYGVVTTAHHARDHSWEGIATDKLLFDSLKAAVKQDPSCPMIRLNTKTRPITFYKATHRYGELAGEYMRRVHPRLLA